MRQSKNIILTTILLFISLTTVSNAKEIKTNQWNPVRITQNQTDKNTCYDEIGQIEQCISADYKISKKGRLHINIDCLATMTPCCGQIKIRTNKGLNLGTYTYTYNKDKKETKVVKKLSKKQIKRIKKSGIKIELIETVYTGMFK